MAAIPAAERRGRDSSARPRTQAASRWTAGPGSGESWRRIEPPDAGLAVSTARLLRMPAAARSPLRLRLPDGRRTDFCTQDTVPSAKPSSQPHDARVHAGSGVRRGSTRAATGLVRSRATRLLSSSCRSRDGKKTHAFSGNEAPEQPPTVVKSRAGIGDGRQGHRAGSLSVAVRTLPDGYCTCARLVTHNAAADAAGNELDDVPIPLHAPFVLAKIFRFIAARWWQVLLRSPGRGAELL